MSESRSSSTVTPTCNVSLFKLVSCREQHNIHNERRKKSVAAGNGETQAKHSQNCMIQVCDSYLQSIYKVFKYCTYRIYKSLHRSEAKTDTFDGSDTDTSPRWLPLVHFTSTDSISPLVFCGVPQRLFSASQEQYPTSLSWTSRYLCDVAQTD